MRVYANQLEKFCQFICTHMTLHAKRVQHGKKHEL